MTPMKNIFFATLLLLGTLSRSGTERDFLSSPLQQNKLPKRIELIDQLHRTDIVIEYVTPVRRDIEICNYSPDTPSLTKETVQMKNAMKEEDLSTIKSIVKSKGINTSLSPILTPLILAIILRKINIIKFLIEQELADVNTPNSKGETPFDFVDEKNIAQLLFKHGARDLNVAIDKKDTLNIEIILDKLDVYQRNKESLRNIMDNINKLNSQEIKSAIYPFVSHLKQ